MCEVGEVRASCHAAASSPTHHTITFTSCTRHSALAHHHTANHRQAVRLELLTEKAALHADRIMKEQAVTPPCSRLQAARSELAHLLPLRPSPSPLPPSIPSSLLALPDPPSPPSLALALPRFLRLPAPRSPSLMSLMSLISLSLSLPLAASYFPAAPAAPRATAAGYFYAAAARERPRRLARVVRGAGTLRCCSKG